MYRLIIIAVVYALTSAGCGDGDGDGCVNGVGPSCNRKNIREVRVESPNPTHFIGQTAQFTATKVFTDGTTEVANQATWGSDNEAVATVSSSGLVTAVAAGEAGIFAVAEHRGTLRIRVYPNFGGSWTGNEVVVGCQDEGMFDGLCADPEFPQVGQAYTHRSRFTQDQASVDAVIDGGDGTSATMTGTITVLGLLELPSASFLPADAVINIQVQNWQSRADVPSQMTGQYELFATAPGVSGSVTTALQLQNVIKVTETAIGRSETDDGGAGARIRDVVASQLERRR